MPRKTNPNRPEYAKIITGARIEKKLSQLQLGQLIGRDAASIKKYEGGKIVPPFFVLMKISDVLVLNKQYLVELVLMTDSTGNWLDAALEEISWIFPLCNIHIDTGDDPKTITIYYGSQKRECEKMRFLFDISWLLQGAHQKYVDIVTSSTNDLIKNLFHGC